jgi:2-haloacid dehalogenase
MRRREFLASGSAAVVTAAFARTAGFAASAGRQELSDRVRGVRAMTFDVFGTVVDWRSSIAREARELGARKGLDADWVAFADRWRGGYGPAMNRVRQGELPWTKIDDLHRMILDELIPEFGLESLSEAERTELNYAWHRLSPWPDAVEGLTRLRARYVLATLSNGNVALLVNMAKAAGLPWDAVLSAELAHAYKPDAVVYRTAADLLGLAPEQVMMVAAHAGDLRASSAVGFRTAYVPRPLEYGPDSGRDLTPDPAFDVVATDFVDLAAQLGL